ncbi:hypothetical protein ACLK16_22240 [Escherichia coli]
MVFNFHHLKVDYPNGDKWTKAPFDFLELKRIFNHWQSGMHGKGLVGPVLVQPRSAAHPLRFGDEGEHRVAAAKMLARVRCTGCKAPPTSIRGRRSA